MYRAIQHGLNNGVYSRVQVPGADEHGLWPPSIADGVIERVMVWSRELEGRSAVDRSDVMAGTAVPVVCVTHASVVVVVRAPGRNASSNRDDNIEDGSRPGEGITDIPLMRREHG